MRRLTTACAIALLGVSSVLAGPEPATEFRKRYTLEWNQEYDALARCNDRIQFWLRVQKLFKL